MQLDREAAQILGLQEEEVLILQTLETGPCKISSISKQTKIPRTSLYYMLPKLENRKLISRQKINKKNLWRKIPDEDIANSYKKILEKISNNTSRTVKTISNKSQLTFYYGNNQVVNVLKEISNLPPHSRFYGIQPESSIVSAVKNSKVDDIIDFNNKVKKNKLIAEGIIHEKGTYTMFQTLSKNDQKRLLASFASRSADTAALPQGFLNTTCAEIYLFSDKVALVNWTEEFAVVIKNKDVFDLVIEMFKSTKYMLQKYDQNEKIAKLLIDEG